MRTHREWFTLAAVAMLGAACDNNVTEVEAPSSDSGIAAAAPAPAYASITLAAGSNPTAAKIGDLDGDGRNDVAVVNLQGHLQIFFNSGTGSFDRVTLSGLWPSSAQTLDIDIGDLNRDGRNDIAVAFATSTGSVSVLLNQGNRSFGAPVNYTTCASSRSLAIGDLDGDGDSDIADVGACSKAGVLRNNGSGTFALAGTFGSGASSSSMVLADFNRDGYKDIAYLNRTTNGYVTVLRNNGNGTFGAQQSLWAGDGPDDIVAGDFNGDGHVDLSIANSYLGYVFQLFNDAQGTFTTGYSELEGGQIPTSIAAGDFNGDGRLDYAVASQGMNEARIFLNTDNYNYTFARSFYVPQTPVDIAAGKLDGDALPDLVTVNHGSGNITLLLSASSPPPPPPTSQPPITLTATTRLTSRARYVDLNWTGVTTSRADVYRNGARIANVPNNKYWMNEFSRGSHGTFRYKVCNAGTQTCSAEATISF